jgi:hypothetical protein
MCQHILGLRASIEAELFSLSREKEYYKVKDFFIHEDGVIDNEACDLLGQLMSHKRARFELEMICGIHFQGRGVNREVGVSLATDITEASIQKFILVLQKNSGKSSAEADVSTIATDTTEDIAAPSIPNIVTNMASGVPSVNDVAVVFNTPPRLCAREFFSEHSQQSQGRMANLAAKQLGEIGLLSPEDLVAVSEVLIKKHQETKSSATATGFKRTLGSIWRTRGIKSSSQTTQVHFHSGTES